MIVNFSNQTTLIYFIHIMFAYKFYSLRPLLINNFTFTIFDNESHISLNHHTHILLQYKTNIYKYR